MGTPRTWYAPSGLRLNCRLTANPYDSIGQRNRFVQPGDERAEIARRHLAGRLAENLRSPYSGPKFMVLELEPGALAGVYGEVRYPTPFDMF